MTCLGISALLCLLLSPQTAARDVIKPYHAGMIYPVDAQTLNSTLRAFFLRKPKLTGIYGVQGTGRMPASLPVLAIVSPHARFDVSGPASAQAFKIVRGQLVRRVFLLAPKHRVNFHGAALPAAPTFKTPLGELKVDQSAVAHLTRCRLFVKDDAVFVTDDHAVELQLPFIRYAFGNVPVVPVIVGNLNGEQEIRLVADKLKNELAPDDLLLISADFTHYGAKYSYIPFTSNVLENIKKLDLQAYECMARHDLRGFMNFQRKTGDTICGYLPCCILLAMLPEDSRAGLLDYDTCDHYLHTLERSGFSVSYMAIAFSGSAWSKSNRGKKVEAGHSAVRDAM